MKVNLKFAFISFALLNFMSGFLRILSHYIPFITKETDMILYVAQIVLFVFIYRIASQKTSDYCDVTKIRRILKAYIICEIATLYIIFMSGNVISILTDVMIVLLFVIKQVLEFLLYYRALWDVTDYCTRADFLHERRLAARRIKIWIFINALLVVSLLPLMCFKVSKILYFIFFVIFVRTWIEIRISKYIGELSDGKSENNLSIRALFCIKLSKREIVNTIIGAGLVGLTLILRFTYIDHDVEMEYDERSLEYHYLDRGDNTLYFNSNLMPSWTGFCDRRYGVHNLETGNDTGAIYKGELFFDRNGIAWDHDRHLIDIYGNELIETPSVMNLQKSYSQKTLDEFIKMCCENDLYQVDTDYVYGGFKGIKSDYSPYEFYHNGIGCYYSDFYDRYGFISENGEAVTSPKYRYIRVYSSSSDDYPVAFVEEEDGNHNILNKDGKELLDEKYGKNKDIYLCHLGIIYITSNDWLNSEQYITSKGLVVTGEAYINTKGEKLSPEYDYSEGELCGDILCVKKYEDDNNTYIFGYDGERLFYSDQYSSYEAHANSKGEITCLLVYSEEKYKYALIDLNGNLVTKDWYSLIEYRGGSYNCYSYANDRTLLETVELE